VVIADDAELPRDRGAGADRPLPARRSSRPDPGIVGDADGGCAGFAGRRVEAKKAERELLSSPQNSVDGEPIETKLPRAGGSTGVGGAGVPIRARVSRRGFRCRSVAADGRLDRPGTGGGVAATNRLARGVRFVACTGSSARAARA
jgi:hypothetical protein